MVAGHRYILIVITADDHGEGERTSASHPLLVPDASNYAHRSSALASVAYQQHSVLEPVRISAEGTLEPCSLRALETLKQKRFDNPENHPK